MRRWLLLAIGMLSGLGVGAQPAFKTQVRLILPAQIVRPGETILAGVELRSAAGWHTYWRNPGESGLATRIEWTLPSGVSAEEIRWPVPEKLVEADIVTYVYRQPAILIVPLKTAATAPAGSVQIKARVSWLECDKECVPGNARLEGAFSIGESTVASSDAATIVAAQKALPGNSAAPARAFWEKAPAGDSRAMIIEWETKEEGRDFFPYANDKFEVAGKSEILKSSDGKFRLRKMVKKTEGGWPAEISGVLATGNSTGYEVKLALDVGTVTSGIGNDSASSMAGPGWVKMLWFAFFGGLILNVMPCVLPVIALKILGFVQQSKGAPAEVKKLGIIYALGVLASFLVLALLVIGVQRAGHLASWGMQFQNAQFLVVMTTLVTLVSLNLFGVFEVVLGGRAMGAAGELASKDGPSGAFFNGILATALATPCTAPFLAPALGFAFSQSPGVIILMFLVAGLGLAAPYLILSWNPEWLRFLPKPGAWMERFKVAMGFPMLATAIWMFSLAAAHFGKRGTLWLGLYLVFVGMAVWVWGEFVQRGSRRKALATVIALALFATGYGYALEKELHWRAPGPVERSGLSLKESPEGIDWQPWSLAAVEKARAEGHPVLVDFTADWCLTCQVNKKTSLEISAVRQKLVAIGAVSFLADNTSENPAIAAELKKYGRAGVPLVLVYPKEPGAAAMDLPSLLTPGIVLEALEKASK